MRQAGQSKNHIGRFAGRWRIAAAGVIGLASLSAVVLPAQEAGAATDVVTNCSGDVSTSGSLPYEVANASSGDTVTFAPSPSCWLITLSSTIGLSHNITITGRGPAAWR